MVLGVRTYVVRVVWCTYKWVNSVTGAVLFLLSCLSPLDSLQVDTIGQPLSELLHPDDLPQAEQSLESLFAGNEGEVRGDFLTRMRTTLSTAVRSSSKIQYKVRLPTLTKDPTMTVPSQYYAVLIKCPIRWDSVSNRLFVFTAECVCYLPNEDSE